MYLTDYHTHTRLSPDSQADPRDMILAARAAGLRELCFTDHVDLLDMGGHPDTFQGWEGYAAQFDEAEAFAPPGLRIVRGIELGEIWEDPEQAKEITAWAPLDFVIGSVHNLDAAHGGADFALFRYHDNEELCREVLDVYFSCMERLAQLDCYDVLGHVNYPLRYMNRRDGNHIPLEPYLPQLEKVFRTIIPRGKGIELNTDRGRMVEEWRPILALYRDCGGRIITTGSDGHLPRDLAQGIPQGAEMLKEFGFSLAVYEKRQPRLIPLN